MSSFASARACRSSPRAIFAALKSVRMSSLRRLEWRKERRLLRRHAAQYVETLSGEDAFGRSRCGQDLSRCAGARNWRLLWVSLDEMRLHRHTDLQCPSAFWLRGTPARCVWSYALRTKTETDFAAPDFFGTKWNQFGIWGGCK